MLYYVQEVKQPFFLQILTYKISTNYMFIKILQYSVSIKLLDVRIVQNSSNIDIGQIYSYKIITYRYL